jgi:hypothetical protein
MIRWTSIFLRMPPPLIPPYTNEDILEWSHHMRIALHHHASIYEAALAITVIAATLAAIHGRWGSLAFTAVCAIVFLGLRIGTARAITLIKTAAETP